MFRIGELTGELPVNTVVMDQKRPPPPLLRFGAFVVGPGSREIRKHGLRISLESKPFEILLTLLENPGQVTTREALRQQLWPDRLTRSDHNLDTAINKLRETLGDSHANPRFVETLPRIGYRFIANVEKLDGPKPSAAKPPASRTSKDSSS
jgi:cholera toxin transcriptional activator